MWAWADPPHRLYLMTLRASLSCHTSAASTSSRRVCSFSPMTVAWRMPWWTARTATTRCAPSVTSSPTPWPGTLRGCCSAQGARKARGEQLLAPPPPPKTVLTHHKKGRNGSFEGVSSAFCLAFCPSAGHFPCHDESSGNEVPVHWGNTCLPFSMAPAKVGRVVGG